MTVLQGSSAIAAVAPLPHSPTIDREWAGRGLPESGWVLVKDAVLCARCPDPESIACINGCIANHSLPYDGRAAMGTCAHCDPAPCEEVCPVAAVSHTDQGVVVVDQELCIGCRFCEDVCDNGALLYIDPFLTRVPAYGIPGYSTGRPYGELPNTVAKCTLCSDRLLSGRMTVCGEACPLDAIWVGNLDRDTATDGHRVVRLSKLLEGRRYRTADPGRRVLEMYG